MAQGLPRCLEEKRFIVRGIGVDKTARDIECCLRIGVSLDQPCRVGVFVGRVFQEALRDVTLSHSLSRKKQERFHFQATIYKSTNQTERESLRVGRLVLARV